MCKGRSAAAQEGLGEGEGEGEGGGGGRGSGWGMRSPGAVSRGDGAGG